LQEDNMKHAPHPWLPDRCWSNPDVIWRYRRYISAPSDLELFEAQIARYREHRRREEQARAQIEAAPILKALSRVNLPWRSTMTDLHRAFGPAGRHWLNARGLSCALRANLGALRAAGIDITFTRAHGVRRVALRPVE
jgi:hypothetical protein